MIGGSLPITKLIMYDSLVFECGDISCSRSVSHSHLRFLSIRTSIPYGKYDPIHTEMQGKSKKMEQNFIHLFVFLN